MKTIRLFIVTALCMMLGYSMTLNVEAKTVTLSNGEVFDSDFYAELYPDVKAAYGTDADLLLQHYNDPYGYFCLGVSSCAGCARATGLCLNMLGISYEHVNENQWSHQWCRINVDGTYWICDPYGLYVGQEPSPYAHPYIY